MKYLMRSGLLVLALGLSVCMGRTEPDEKVAGMSGASCPVVSRAVGVDDNRDPRVSRADTRWKDSAESDAWPDDEAQ
ncbi:MAG: hypothetical protein WCD70_08945 [Alphaproteobacteria bacterium]